MSDTTLTILIIAAVVVLALIGAATYLLSQRHRTERLQQRFGPEYERSLDKTGDRGQAEAQLRAREKRHQEFELRPLDPAQRTEFADRWARVQQKFVDDPARAVRDADQFVVEVMSARGYPVEDVDRRAEDLSVEHPVVTQHYREARRISQANERGDASTEQLRTALTSYRSLVDALLEHPEDKGSRPSEGTPDRRGTAPKETQA